MRKNSLISQGRFNYNSLIFIISLLILLALVITTNIFKVSALGITPGATTVQFEPGLKQNINLEIINSENKEMDVLLLAEGELKKYITLETSSLHFSSNEASKKFAYTLELPESFDKPGRYSADIKAVEAAKATEGEVVVGVSLSVISKLDVYVPYPDEYAEMELEIVAPSREGQTAKFFAPVINRGQKKIEKAKLKIDIYSKERKVASIESEEISFGPLERKELILEWLADVAQGEYKAVATLTYSGKTAQTEKQFTIGQMALDIVQIYVKDFKLGSIAKFNTIVDNNWDSELKNVYFSVTVYDKGGVLAEFRSPTREKVPQGRSEISAYWDTENVEAGTYDAKFRIDYEDKRVERNIKIIVKEDAIIVTDITGYALAKGEKGYITKKLLVIIIISLLAIIVILLAIIKIIARKKGRKQFGGVEVVKKA